MIDRPPLLVSDGQQNATFSLGPQVLRLACFVCLVGLAVNAVIIQTIVTDEQSPVKTLVRLVVLMIAAFAIFAGRAIVPQWMLFLALLSVILLITRGNTDQLSYVFVLVLVPLLWSIPERRLLGLIALGSLGSLLLVFVFLRLGLTYNQTLEFRNRETYGTKGVPFFFNVVYGAMSMSILYTWKYHRRLAAVVVIPAALMATTYLYVQTDARGGYYSLLAFVILLPVVPVAARLKLFQWVVAAIPPLCIAASAGIASMHSNPYYDELLSYRPTLINAFLDHITVTDVLLSTSVKNFSEVVSQVRTVDNSFLHLLVGGGLMMTAAFCLAFGSAITYLFRAKRHADLAFMIATALYFNSESILLRIENLFVIYAWYLILRYCAWSRHALDPPGEPAFEPAADAINSRADGAVA